MLYEEEQTSKELKQFSIDDISVTPLPTNNANFSGGAIQTKNRYVTAMQVLKPRNLNRVISKCVEKLV